MKICFIAKARVVHTQRWVKYFADKGYETHLISPSPWGDGSIEGVRLHVIKRCRWPIPVISLLFEQAYSLICVRRLIRRIRPDIVHAHFIRICGLWGALSGFHPFVLTVWGPDILIWPKQSRLMKWLTRFVLKRVDLVTSNGENVLREMVRLGADRNKTSLIQHGVDVRRFSPEQQDRKLKEGLGMSGSPVIISVRRLFPIYDVTSLIKAIPMVLAHIPNAKFIIAGDGEQRGYLKNLAASLGVSDNIRWLGKLPHDQMPRYLASSDIYVSTSLSDAVSVSLHEAMACGLPVIVTDTGDNRNWVKDGLNGFLVPVKSPQKLALKITYLLQNDDVRVKFAGSNRKVVEDRAHYQREMDKMDSLYSELVKGSSNRMEQS